MIIREPGIYYDLIDSDYRKDPCPVPSLTQSLAKVLLERSPRHAWEQCPRLNPAFEPDDDTKFDLGNVAHKLMLGRGKDFVVLPFDDWKTKAARAEREAAAAHGKLAVLDHQYKRAVDMELAAHVQLKAAGLAHFFADGAGEVVLAWKEGDLWLRQMLDWLIDGHIMLDYKTTDQSVAPHALPRLMVTGGWDVQAAMAERGLTALKQPSGRRFIFVAQETQSPYCLSIAEMSEEVLTIGRKKLTAAIAIWDRCMQERKWPGYPLLINTPEYPGWAEQQWLEREVKDAARERLPAGADLIMAG